MSFDITAHDKNGNPIAYISVYMGAFRMCREQGYDWFKLIDAKDCDGTVSGRGFSKMIKLKDLMNAMNNLKLFNPNGRLSSEGRNEWAHRKPILRRFMRKCINWCLSLKEIEVEIYFG